LRSTHKGLWVKIYVRLTSIFLQFPIKPSCYYVNRFTHDKLIYHNNLSNFFPRYLNPHLGNTLLVDNTPYKTCLNSPSNAVFVESYEYTPKKDNYLMKTLFLYLKFLHYSRLIVPTFMELYPFGPLKVSRKTMSNFKCRSKNGPCLVLSIFIEITQIHSK